MGEGFLSRIFGRNEVDTSLLNEKAEPENGNGGNGASPVYREKFVVRKEPKPPVEDPNGVKRMKPEREAKLRAIEEEARREQDARLRATTQTPDGKPRVTSKDEDPDYPEYVQG